MKAFIIAGGRGTRLLPYTVTIPKPLLPIGDMAAIEILVRQLIAQGFDDITISTGYLSHLIKAHFENLRDLQSFKLKFLDEVAPTGTAGSLLSVNPEDFDNLLVLNADLLTNINFASIMEFHERKQVDLTIGFQKSILKSNYGVINFDSNSRNLMSFVEKPEYNQHVSIGIYVISRRVLQMNFLENRMDMPTLIQFALEAGLVVKCWECLGYWQDIGQFDDYDKANTFFLNNPQKFGLS